MPGPSPDQVPQNWSAITSGYENAFEGLSSQFAADVIPLLNLEAGQRVLDVAAGTGAFSLMAAQHGAHVLATDFAAGMVERIRARAAALNLSHVAAEVMDGQALTVPDGSFDVSVSILGLIFFPDLQRGMSELRRVLRPGGRGAVVCWGDMQKLQLMSAVLDAVRTVMPAFQPAGMPVWARLMGAEALRDQMQAAGFRDVQVTTVTRALQIAAPDSFWNEFNHSAPPLAAMFDQLGPERTAEVGAVFTQSLLARATDGVATLSTEACIGIGRAAEDS